MPNILKSKEEAAVALCAATIPRLASSGCMDVADKLTTIQDLIQSGAITQAFEAYRNLPRHDIVFLWDDMDWMFSEDERVPVAEKALTTAYYNQTLRALGDLRVSVLYGFERPLIDSSPATVQQLATELVSTLRPRADGI
ncbi:hypothetical protein [Stenotrophomonas pigmentata]|uniref:hypothetical protein n=1 Tax=Stenotrophomonas pigmentata TaxID=3055080 RepID=UPI0026EEE112|nr:hypothetical protein [Stenotrophomonas sp. 610A2]